MYFGGFTPDFSGITKPIGDTGQSFGDQYVEGVKSGAITPGTSRKSRFGKIGSYFKRAAKNVEDYGKRAKKQSIEGYRRYKDPIIVGAGALAGALIGGIPTLGLGAPAGAMMGASLAGGARGMHNQKKAERAARASSDDFLNYFGGGRRMTNKKRQAGEGDVSFSTMEDVL